jgi:hypothetical protein
MSLQIRKAHQVRETTVEFSFACEPRLVNDEHAVFATCYITSDVGALPTLFDTRTADSRNTKTAAASLSRVEFTARFDISDALRKQSRIAADAAVCVQTFCHLSNHHREKCIHRCGFAAFCLRGLARAGVGRYSVNMRDHGPGFDGRGTAVLTLDVACVNVLRAVKFADPNSEDLIGQATCAAGNVSSGVSDEMNGMCLSCVCICVYVLDTTDIHTICKERRQCSTQRRADAIMMKHVYWHCNTA